jgi:hypothetical protein
VHDIGKNDGPMMCYFISPTYEKAQESTHACHYLPLFCAVVCVLSPFPQSYPSLCNEYAVSYAHLSFHHAIHPAITRPSTQWNPFWPLYVGPNPRPEYAELPSSK